VARLRRLSRIQASRSASLSHDSRQLSVLQPFLDSDFFDCPVFGVWRKPVMLIGTWYIAGLASLLTVIHYPVCRKSSFQRWLSRASVELLFYDTLELCLHLTLIVTGRLATLTEQDYKHELPFPTPIFPGPIIESFRHACRASQRSAAFSARPRQRQYDYGEGWIGLHVGPDPWQG